MRQCSQAKSCELSGERLQRLEILAHHQNNLMRLPLLCAAENEFCSKASGDFMRQLEPMLRM